ncbi:MAG TPA: pantetheine-phosphate adenylyltransferase, partial [Actinomycetaceae bacterium]|nr:pantetheine-phosphate adenylyltransferase [Actinomycetaceae bacterium]
RDVGAGVIVKGLRGSSDLDGEAPMATMNRHLAGVETVFLLASGSRQHIASSLVKDIARHGGNIADLVPPEVDAALARAFAHTKESR